MGCHSRLPIGGLLCGLGGLGSIYYSGDGASNKTAKYARLISDYHFQQIAVESLGPANELAIRLFTVIGKKIAQQTCDERETVFLFQLLSILV